MLSRTFIIIIVAYSFLVSCHAYAVTTSWNTDASGTFNTAANWDNGVPDSDDTAIFNRRFVGYTVTFAGGTIFEPPVNYAITYLRVNNNQVNFVWNDSFPLQASPTLSVLSPGVSIVVGENAGEVGILGTTLASFSGANTSIGRAPGANGTLNVVGGMFSMSGNLEVGDSGTGTLNVTNGGTVTNANGFIGINPSSLGRVNVSGANSVWANSNSLFVGHGRLDVNDGGVVSVTNVLQVNGGQLTGNGLIQGNVENSGHIAPSPGTSSGTLHIDGNLGQSAVGELTIQITAADSFDKLDVDGNVTFGGTLNVQRFLSYSPELGDTFDILDWTGARNGTFATVNLSPLGDGLGWDTSQLYTSGVLSVVPSKFQPSDVVTYSQDVWGSPFSTTAQLLLTHFDAVYFSVGGTMVVGNPITMNFTSASAIHNYMPSIGTPGPLTASSVDPLSSASGQFGGEVVALKLNIDFSDAGHTLGALGIPFGDLVFHDYASLPQFNGLTVREILGEANLALGGGAVGFSITDANLLLIQLNGSFEDGVVSQFAHDHLRIAGDFNGDGSVDAADYVVWRNNGGSPTEYTEWRTNFGWTAGSGSGSAARYAVPEPGTLALVALAAVVLGSRRSRRG